MCDISWLIYNSRNTPTRNCESVCYQESLSVGSWTNKSLCISKRYR